METISSTASCQRISQLLANFMIHRDLPQLSFIDPQGNNRHQIERLIAEAVEVVLSHTTQAASRHPLPDNLKIGEDLAEIPEYATAESTLLAKLQQIVETSMNAAHPGYIGHMDSIPTTMSLVGDLVAAALNNNMLSVEMSPLFSRLEPLLLRQFAQMFGLGDRAGGILLSGGSLSNLQALAVARNAILSVKEKGIAGLGKQPVILAAEAAHTSLEKAAMVLGLGTSGVVRVATNENAQMRVDALEAAIQQAWNAGKMPFAIAATAGTTATGNIDPLPEISQIARQYQLWFHVDAVYGGALVFSPQYQHYLNGIENADSVSFNPQKWLYVAKTCSMVLFRDFAGLADTFQIEAPYMQRSPQWWNLGEVSVQGTRHADILKLWLSLQHLGKQGYTCLIEQSYELTAYFVAAIRERSYLQLATEPQINVICFRLAASDRDNEQLQKFLLQEYNTFLSLHRYQQKQWLKAVLLNPYTSQTEIDKLFAGIDTFWHNHQ